MMAVDAMGEKAAWLLLIFILLHIGHVHIHEVLRGVLYPEVHGTVIDAKKKFNPSVHARICRTTTLFADAALFDMVRQFTLHHAELQHTHKHTILRTEP